MNHRKYLEEEIDILRRWSDDCKRASDAALKHDQEAHTEAENLKLVLRIGNEDEIKAVADAIYLERAQMEKALAEDEEDLDYQLPALSPAPDRRLN